MFLSKISINSCIIILYTVEKIFLLLLFTRFNTEEILTRHIKDCFKINGKQKITIPKKGEYVKFKNYERKTVTVYDLCKLLKYFSTKR